jgi:tetratricopeptide (TPR) repeat protein
MKNTLLVFIIGAVFAVTGCWGGTPIKTTPPHLKAGTDQIAKGTTAYKKGCYKQAFEYFFRAHELYAASDQTEGVAMSFNNLGTVYRSTGDTQSALAFFGKACDIYKDIGNPAGEKQALCNKAAALIDLGRLDEAEAILNEVSKQSDSASFVPLLSNRGVLLTKKKDYPGAEKELREASAAAGSENLSEQATVNSALGNLMLETKRYREAIAFYQTALEADRTDGFYRGIADNLSSIGQAYLEMGDRRAAVKSWEQSAKTYTLIGLSADVKKVMANLKREAAKAGVDISVTELFVNRWLEGKQYEKPCEE